MKFLNKINNPEQLKRLSRTDLPTLVGKIPRIIENVWQGGFGSAGGAYTLLTEDTLVTGPGRGPKQLNAADITTKETMTF